MAQVAVELGRMSAEPAHFESCHSTSLLTGKGHGQTRWTRCMAGYGERADSLLIWRSLSYEGRRQRKAGVRSAARHEASEGASGEAERRGTAVKARGARGLRSWRERCA